MVFSAESLLRRFNRAGRDVWYHGDLPGYESLPWYTRCRVNLQAGGRLLRSGEFVRLLAWLSIWILGAYTVNWTHDLRGPAAAYLPMSAVCWALPWLAALRRRLIHELLGGRWPE